MQSELPGYRNFGIRKTFTAELMARAINLQGCQLLFWHFFLFGKEKSVSFSLIKGKCF